MKKKVMSIAILTIMIICLFGCGSAAFGGNANATVEEESTEMADEDEEGDDEFTDANEDTEGLAQFKGVFVNEELNLKYIIDGEGHGQRIVLDQSKQKYEPRDVSIWKAGEPYVICASNEAVHKIECDGEYIYINGYSFKKIDEEIVFE